MNINQILCPIDFSQSNGMANEVASMLAESSGASIIYLHVAQIGLMGETHDYAMQRIGDRKLQEKHLLKHVIRLTIQFLCMQRQRNQMS